MSSTPFYAVTKLTDWASIQSRIERRRKEYHKQNISTFNPVISPVGIRDQYLYLTCSNDDFETIARILTGYECMVEKQRARRGSSIKKEPPLWTMVPIV